MQRLAWLAILIIGGTGGCGAATATPCPQASLPTEHGGEPTSELRLGHAANQFHTLPVTINERVLTVAILDTGIGIELISAALCERIACDIDGEFVGRRMSGQEVRVPTTHIPQLRIGNVIRDNVVAGVIDIEGFFPEPQIEAFVGLPFFTDHAFTIDGPNRRLIIESDESLAARANRSRAVPIRLQRHGPALDTFVEMTLGEDLPTAELLMDTGSRRLILHPRYADALGVDLLAPDVRRREGHDETGNEYQRHYTVLETPIAFTGAPELERRGAEVMFQEIIYDGLVGTDFLSPLVVTWDLRHSRLLVADNVSRNP